MRACVIGTGFLLLAASTAACSQSAGKEVADTSDTALSNTSHTTTIDNATPIKNVGGFASTYSTQGSLDLTNEFHTPQGTNGRSCATCHTPFAGWSITPEMIEDLFVESDGTDPIFNPIEANNPANDVSTVEARAVSYSMLRKGLFRRGAIAPATREFDIIEANDPFGYGSVATQRFSFFHRPLSTANFHVARNLIWDDKFTRSGQTMLAALTAQVPANITGSQQGAPPTTTTINDIVAYESSLAFAQDIIKGVGRLDDNGGRGGSTLLSSQAFVAGRFNLYDAWLPGVSTDDNPRRASIARGQELFNTKARTGGGTCNGCHSAENSGASAEGHLFNTGVSDPKYAAIDGLPVYTVKNRATGETLVTTDPGKANITGKWADMNHFKSPTLRGLSARAPYFHNGMAKSLTDVVHFYEDQMGFVFTPDEETDLVAFMNAL